MPLSDIERWIREDALPRGLHMRLFVRAVLAGAAFDAAALQRLFGIALDEALTFCGRYCPIVTLHPSTESGQP